MSKIFVPDYFKEIYSTEWISYYEDFKVYKINNQQIDRFGRDARLNVDFMHHIHLAKDQAVIEGWKPIKNNYYRTNPVNSPDLDFFLIYAHDPVNDWYLLMWIAGPNAHNKKEWTSTYTNLKVKFYDPWIEGRLIHQEGP